MREELHKAYCDGLQDGVEMEIEIGESQTWDSGYSFGWKDGRREMRMHFEEDGL